jgi:hypothetical protein
VRTPMRRRVPPPVDFEPEPRMLFGKFIGEPVSALPDHYLCSADTVPTIRSERLADAIDEEHQRRCGQRHTPEEFEARR